MSDKTSQDYVDALTRELASAHQLLNEERAKELAVIAAARVIATDSTIKVINGMRFLDYADPASDGSGLEEDKHIIALIDALAALSKQDAPAPQEGK